VILIKPFTIKIKFNVFKDKTFVGDCTVWTKYLLQYKILSRYDIKFC